MWVMHEVASGAELAVFVLVVVPTHLLAQNGLMEYKLLDTMSEETVFCIAAVTGFFVGFAELEFTFEGRIGGYFVRCQFHAHK
jgi:hypothetical protein